MIAEFCLPDLGEGLPEAELVQWLVTEGDEVALNQTIAEVETAKAIVELPSPHAGRITMLHAAAGDVIAVGSVIMSVDVVGAGDDADVHTNTDATPAAAAAPAVPATAGDAPRPNLVGYGAAPASGARPQRRRRTASAGAAGDTHVRQAAPHDAARTLEPEPAPTDRPRSTPPVRRLSKELGVDLALVTATGHDSRVTRADVGSFAAGRAAAPAATLTPITSTDPSDTRIPVRGVRKVTAQAMVHSAFTAPHATVFLTVDVTETTRLVASLREDRALAAHRIGILAVAAKAVCLTLPRHPMLNSRWEGEEIVQFGRVNLGIAAATDRGLVVPNVKDAGALALPALADAIAALAETARAGRSQPDALAGGTFTITNVGVFGVDAGTPILNPGEAGILALGTVRPTPWEHEGQVALRDVLTLSLSFDHRLVDGEQGARFLADVAALLRQPARALLVA
ncbi:2-oxo acid dehydrogenase subunit E2 [Microbacterium sp. Sa4CUA7]|uniref:Dihydrolipoamide acetyltransferase component of pyruvate dehydrogenase complex n=1 Tax=Microbacterium pullorum TaxID=2762236 RepID=A0ABR8S386_9MICO|nr:dihydrolipoamide acetyltransferase family protein [Microbacterium pullorum]MBD7957941.1 2-oxo acid dehydrogenase subunit E2 [Microbacterium pullorum]